MGDQKKSGTTVEYWNSYYESKTAPKLPSQFAVFCLGEFPSDCIIDVGCGSGRDSLFFARYGVRTIGIDVSGTAIAGCQAAAKTASLDRASFVCSGIGDTGLSDRVLAQLKSEDAGKSLVYSRFFVHAIDDQNQHGLLAFASNIIRATGGRLAVEFRTPRDRFQEKTTPDHYRRYVEPASFISEARAFDLRPQYFVEGFGLAKYKNDDAFVARIVLA